MLIYGWAAGPTNTNDRGLSTKGPVLYSALRYITKRGPTGPVARCRRKRAKPVTKVKGFALNRISVRASGPYTLLTTYVLSPPDLPKGEGGES